jgi:hypothetical protein
MPLLNAGVSAEIILSAYKAFVKPKTPPALLPWPGF